MTRGIVLLYVLFPIIAFISIYKSTNKQTNNLSILYFTSDRLANLIANRSAGRF